MDCSTPCLPVPHHLPEFAQVHVHCISDAVQPSHLLVPSSPSALHLSQHQGLFQWVVCLHQMSKILELLLQHQFFQWIFRVDLLDVQGTLKNLLQHHSWKAINSSVFCLLYGPALTTVCDHWEDHSLDYTDLCRQSNVSAFQHTVWACQCFPAKKQLPSAIMAAVALHSDLPTKRKSVTASTFSPSVRQAVMGLDAINLVFGFFKKKFINYQFHHFLHDNFLSLFLFSCLFWRLCLFVMNSHLLKCYFISSYVWAFLAEGLSMPYCYPKHSMLSGSQKENKQTPNKKLPEE